jgi:hypothetical protein
MSDQGVLIRQLQAVVKFLFGKSIAFGSGTFIFSASATSAQVTVPHGLSAAPVLVLLSNRHPQNGLFICYEDGVPDLTNIYAIARQSQNTAVTTTQNFYWFAIG